MYASRTRSGVAAGAVDVAQGAHGLGDRRERGHGACGGGAAAQLDHVLPPALGVVVPGGAREFADRVDPQIPVLIGVVTLARGGVGGGEAVGGRQVDETDGRSVGQGPADRHPFGRELGERPERGPSGIVHGVGEQGDRRAHAVVGGEREQPVRLGRSLDQHARGPRRLQRSPHPTR
jgi:hypothetical protein